MNKILLFAISAGVATAQSFAGDGAADEIRFRSEGILYAVNADNQSTVTVEHPDGGYSQSELIIPETVTDPSTEITYTVTGIGYEAFMDARTVTLTLPKTVTTIAGNAFFSAYYLTTFEVDEDNTAFCADNGILYSKDMSILVSFPSNKDASSYKLPASVTALGDYAFCGVWLTAFQIPENLTRIGSAAFMGTQIKTMVVPASVAEFGSSVFQNCRKLESVEFNNEMTVFPDHTLTYCNMLKTIKLPETIQVIGDYAFDGTFTYGMIQEFTCPEGVQTIGIGAFNGNHGLRKITFGSRLESIGLYAFSNCTQLKEIVSLNPSVPDCFDELNNNDVVACFNNVPGQCVLYVPENSVNDYADKWGAKFSDIRPISSGGILDVAATSADDLKISIANGVLDVEAGMAVEVYDMAGALVGSSASGRLSVAPGKGCYLVRTAMQTVKVAL